MSKRKRQFVTNEVDDFLDKNTSMRITFITGPMGAGKTEKALSLLTDNEDSIIFKGTMVGATPRFETATTHNGKQFAAARVCHVDEIIDILRSRASNRLKTDVVVIDELHFIVFQFGIISFFNELITLNIKELLISTLDKDVNGVLMSNIDTVTKVASEVHRLTAECYFCSSTLADETRLIAASDERILFNPGSNYLDENSIGTINRNGHFYHAVCSNCLIEGKQNETF